MQLWPTQTFFESRQTKSPKLTLWFGLGMAVMGSGIVLQAMLHRQRDQRRTRDHLEALEAVNEICAAITGRPDASDEIMQRIAAVAGRVLRMPMVVVTLFDAEKQQMRVQFRRGIDPTPTKDVYLPDELPISRQCMESGEVVAVSDVSTAGPHTAVELARRNIRALVLLPLVVSGEPIGVIQLADSNVRQFTDADLRMAKLLASEAAITLLNNRLHDEMNAALCALRQALQQRDTLYAVNSAIHTAGSPNQALDRIAELAPPRSTSMFAPSSFAMSNRMTCSRSQPLPTPRPRTSCRSTRSAAASTPPPSCARASR